jgi:hypothetical protein
MEQIAFTTIGYLGAALFIISYFLLSYGRLKADGPVYQVMNVIGALCLIINALNLADLPTLLVNGVWFLIGLVALIRILGNGRSKIKN